MDVLDTVAVLIKIQDFLLFNIEIQKFLHLFQLDTGAVVSDDNIQRILLQLNIDIDREWIIRRYHAMFDGIFYQWL